MLGRNPYKKATWGVHTSLFEVKVEVYENNEQGVGSWLVVFQLQDSD